MGICMLIGMFGGLKLRKIINKTRYIIICIRDYSIFGDDLADETIKIMNGSHNSNINKELENE